ncbi:MAG: hypothetical protein WC539_06885 [Nitrospirota bacterium]
MKKIFSVVICSLIVIVAGCHKQTEQEKVKQVVLNLQKATEEKDVRKIVNTLSKNYRDPQGNSYNEIKGLIIGYFYYYPKISMYIPNIDVSIEDGSAKAVFQALFAGRTNASATTVLPESLGMYAFELVLQKESGDWVVYSAKWERIADTLK